MAAKAEAAISRIVERHGGTSEMKWAKAKKHNLPMYKEVASLYGRLLERNVVKFHSLVVDMEDPFRRHYNGGDKEIGFSKLLFTLLFSIARKYRPYKLFYGYLDDRTTSHTPENLRRMLNNKAASELNLNYGPFRRLHFRKSESSRLIQATDIAAGAIACAWNQHYLRPNAAAHKREMMEHVAASVRVPSLAVQTPMHRADFGIWALKPDPKKRVLRA